MFAISDIILKEKQRLQDWISDRFCFYNVNVTYHARRQSDEEINIQYQLSRSDNHYIGRVNFHGTDVDSRLLRKIVQLGSGRCLREKGLDQAVLKLISTDLFSSASYQLKDNSDGTQDIEFYVTEKEHRTLGIGLGYSSDIGVGVSVDWLHRNLRDRGQRLELNNQLSRDYRKASVSYGMPSLGKRERSVKLLSEIERTQLLDAAVTVKDLRVRIKEPSGLHSSFHYGVKFSESYTSEELYTIRHWRNLLSLRNQLEKRY